MKTMTKVATLSVTALFAGALSLAAAPAAENWDNTCAACHGADGTGQTKQGKKLKLKDYTDKATLGEKTDAELIKIVTDGVIVDGKQRKKGYKDQLTPEEITDLVKFVRGLAK